jgi:ATP-dependent helicase/nuclease subunit A
MLARRALPLPGDLPQRGAMSVAFTTEQQDALERRSGPLALSANAGSGKTSVLVERYVRAVLEDGIAPARILAITFTDRAAGELRERVRERLTGAGEREAARESLAGAFVSTFHGFCARLLRTHAVLAGRSPDFAVLGEAQAAALRESAFDAALEGWLADAAALELAAAFGVGELRSVIEAVHEELRSRGERAPALPPAVARHDPALAAVALDRSARALAVELAAAPASRSVERALERLDDCLALTAAGDEHAPARVQALALQNGSSALATPACAAYEAVRAAYAEACADRLGVPAVALLDGLLRIFGERYDALKRRRGLVDFDDLELEAGALLAEHEEVRELWAQRFERLMVDELQDTNARQMAILHALDRDNLFTVGDEFQSIYGFRHADVRLFRRRREALAATGAASVLSTNFRSREPLLRAVNAVFAERFGAGFVPLVAGRAQPAVTSAPLLELLVVDLDGWEPHEERLGAELAPAPLWRRAEARALARRIDELIAAGEAQAEDIVVLLRAGTSLGVYETAIADLGHATLATAGGGFFARAEVVDLTAYLQALANPRDELALYGVLASPLCGCSSDALVALELAAREEGRSPYEQLVASPPDARSAAFAERFAQARRAAADRTLGEIVASAVAENGYDLHLAALHAPERRIANVRKLERLARDYEAREGRDLRRFVAALALGRLGSTHETEAPPPAAGTGAIRLMTIHSAKGLEFPVVCLADLGHQPNTSQPALLTDGERVGLRLPTLEHEPLETLAYAQLKEERAAAAAAEEVRVIYVAMTRACERLILSGAARFSRWPPASSGTTIAWLGPALVEDLAERAAALAAADDGERQERVLPERAGGLAAGDDGERQEPPQRAVEELLAAGGASLRLTLATAALADQLLWPADGARHVEAAPPPEADPMPNAPPGMRISATDQRTLSYTAIAEYERCAYRYHLQRVIGLPDVAPPGGGGGEGAAARGLVVHALLERFDFAAPALPDAAAVTAAASAAGVALAPGEDLAALGALAGAFARSPLCVRLAAARELHREQAFAFLLRGEVLLRGFLDIAGLEADGTLLVVDYKSDRIAAEEDLEAHFERDYSMQRLVYALAGLAAGAAAVEVAHCFLRRPETVLLARYPASERERLEQALAQALEPLRAGRFEVSPNPGRERCGTCPGRARLCSYEEAVTLAES